jgi:hypothetical protein
MSLWLLALLALIPSLVGVLWLIWQSDALNISDFEMTSEEEDYYEDLRVR